MKPQTSLTMTSLRPGSTPGISRSAMRTKGSSSIASGVSMRMRTTPSAARRNAYGSLSPVGRMPIAKNPARASSRSASATAMLASPTGSASPAKRGQ
jgi:hypothetical protein